MVLSVVTGSLMKEEAMGGFYGDLRFLTVELSVVRFARVINSRGSRGSEE